MPKRLIANSDKMERTSSVTASMLARPDGTSITGCALYLRTSNLSKLCRYDIHYHRSPRVPASLHRRGHAHQVLQPQGVGYLFLVLKYSMVSLNEENRPRIISTEITPIRPMMMPNDGLEGNLLPPN